MRKKDNESDDYPYSISQSMTNSPGGIQAGRDVVINPHRLWGLLDEKLEVLRRRMAPFARSEDRGDLITCVLGDSESTKFAVSLVGAFRAAGWDLPGYGYNQVVRLPAIQGILLTLSSSNPYPPAFEEFVTTLREGGIEPRGELVNNLPADRFQIFVGSRPHP